MTRLIDADALKKHIMDLFEEEEKNDKKWAMGLKYSLKIIDKAPTIDINTELSVAYLKGRRQGQTENTKMKYQIEINGIPIEKLGLSSVTVEDRPHGKWITQSDVDGFTYWKCSECNKESDFIPFNYCPNCGAKMDGQEADNDL